MSTNKDSLLAHNKIENGTAHQVTQHIRFGLTPLSFGTLLPSVATSYMLRTFPEFFKYALLIHAIRPTNQLAFLKKPRICTAMEKSSTIFKYHGAN